VDRQPPLGIISGALVFLAGLQGVIDRCPRPHLTGPDINAAPDAEGVALEDAGQLLEVDRQGAQHRRRSAAELSLKLLGQLIIPVPASLPQTDHEFASQLRGSVHALHDGREGAVTSQLQRIIIGANAAEQLDDSPSVTTIYRRPQGGALLL
jgi:HPt (histidine-containing phosphotransfer) domain-containing protein